MKSRGLEFLKWNLEASRFFILKLKLRALFYLRTAVSARWAVKSPLVKARMRLKKRKRAAPFGNRHKNKAIKSTVRYTTIKVSARIGETWRSATRPKNASQFHITAALSEAKVSAEEFNKECWNTVSLRSTNRSSFVCSRKHLVMVITYSAK